MHTVQCLLWKLPRPEKEYLKKKVERYYCISSQTSYIPVRTYSRMQMVTPFRIVQTAGQETAELVYIKNIIFT
jgi:hypothetical protein